MGSQYPRGGETRAEQALPLVNPGNVPLVRINGLADMEVRNGWLWTSYYVLKRIPQRVPDFSEYHPRARFLCLEMLCPLEDYLAMRKVAQEATSRLAPLAMMMMFIA